MNAKHTPGPWTAEFGIDQMVSMDTTVCSIPAAGTRGGWFIFSPADDNGEAEANARLIAAAPDLLEALRAIYKEAFSENDPDHCHHCHTRVGAHEPWCAAGIARAAIDKAEGR